MNIRKEIILELLTEDSVSVVTKSFITIDGVEKQIGNNERRAYINSVSGRSEVEANLPAEDQAAIFAKWGDNPTIDDSEME